jgi:hypothetical protein
VARYPAGDQTNLKRNLDKKFISNWWKLPPVYGKKETAWLIKKNCALNGKSVCGIIHSLKASDEDNL